MYLFIYVSIYLSNYLCIYQGELIWRNEDVISIIEEHGDSIALIWLAGVHYATGHVFDMKSITEAGHRKVHTS